MQTEFGIIAEHHNKALEKDGYVKALVVDTKKATWKGMKWKELTSFGKRKFENLIVLKMFGKNPEQRIKILYND